MLVVRVLIWCVLGYVGGRIAARKGYPPKSGMAVGVLFGPIGLVAAAVLPRTRQAPEQARFEPPPASTDTPPDNGTDACASADVWMGPVRFFALLVTAGLFLACFQDVLFQERNFAFRDVGHFYHPLFRYIQQEWSAGRVPTWNPFDNCGAPLIASATSSVFYPGKLVFFLPIPFDSAFKAFVLGHLILAAAGAWLVARHWRQSELAAMLVAISYAFGGAVIFQYCNVPYLCGAAWLPFGMLAGERVLQRPNALRITALGSVLAMMVLVGEPQAGYHTGIVLGILWLIRVAMSRLKKGSDPLEGVAKPAKIQSQERGRPLSQPAGRRSSSRGGAQATDGTTENGSAEIQVAPWRQLAALMMAAVVGAALSCIQLLPSLEYMRQSERASGQVPRSLWEIPAYLIDGGDQSPRPDTGAPPGWFDALVGDPPPPAKHFSRTFGFSILPVRLCECLVPNAGGAVLPGMPGQARLWRLLGESETEVWMPSLYFGLLPCLLAVCSFRLLRGPLRLRWLTWTALLFALGSFGRYGPGYLFSSAESEAARGLAGGVGGVYWLFVVLLPGYVAFRYPSKLWTVAALALSLLAGFGWDTLNGSDSGSAILRNRLRRICGLLLGVGVVGFSLTLASRLTMVEGQLWGEVRALAAAKDLTQAFAHLAVVSGSMLWVFRRKPPSGRPANHRRQFFLLTLLAVDLGVAHSWSILSASESLWRDKPAAVELVETISRSPDLEPLPRRVYVTPRLPLRERDAAASQADSAVVMVATLNDLLDSQLHMPWRVQQIWNHQSSIKDVLRQAWFEPLPLGRVIVRPRRAYDQWGAELFVIGDWPETQPMPYEENLIWSNTGMQRRWDQTRWNAANPLHTLVPRGRELPVHPATREKLATYLVDARVNLDAVPPVRIVREVEFRPPISNRNLSEWLPIRESAVFPLKEFRDLRTMAVVEDPSLAPGTRPEIRTLGSGRPGEDETRVVHYEPGRIVLETDLETSGLLVLAETYAPGWTVKVATDGRAPRKGRILRTNLAMRGVHLDAGSHRLEFSYRPASVYRGAMVSMIACFGVILLAGWHCLRRLIPSGSRRSRKPTA